MRLDKDDVLSMSENRLVNFPIARLKDIEAGIKDHANSNLRAWLSDEGTSCEILQISGGGWIKGKVRIKTIIEFTPDAALPTQTDVILGGLEVENDVLPL
jgi:KGK domain